MPNYLDFLVALDEHIAGSNLGCVFDGFELYGVSQRAGLTAPGDLTPAQWTGELVHHGYVTHGPLSAGDGRPLPPPTMWSEHDLARVRDYRITPTGRAEADRVRRQGREALTDAALGGGVVGSLPTLVDQRQLAAVTGPLGNLRAALDSERWPAAIGAAKDLVEAACKVAVNRTGGRTPIGASLSAVFTEALRARGDGSAHAKVGRSLAAAVQALAETRNAVGSGHGHAAQGDVSAGEARLAASAAYGIALFVLTP